MRSLYLYIIYERICCMKFLFHVDQVKVSWGSIYSNESLVARVSRVVAFSVKRVCHSECLATFIKLFSPQVTDFFSRTDDLFNEMIWQKKLRGKSFQVYYFYSKSKNSQGGALLEAFECLY